MANIELMSLLEWQRRPAESVDSSAEAGVDPGKADEVSQIEMSDEHTQDGVR